MMNSLVSISAMQGRAAMNNLNKITIPTAPLHDTQNTSSDVWPHHGMCVLRLKLERYVIVDK